MMGQGEKGRGSEGTGREGEEGKRKGERDKGKKREGELRVVLSVRREKEEGEKGRSRKGLRGGGGWGEKERGWAETCTFSFWGKIAQTSFKDHWITKTVFLLAYNLANDSFFCTSH